MKVTITNTFLVDKTITVDADDINDALERNMNNEYDAAWNEVAFDDSYEWHSTVYKDETGKRLVL